NLLVSTLAGMRGGVERSRSSRRPPLTKLAPPRSIVALSTVGFDHGKLLGASASSRFSPAILAEHSWRQSSSASLMRPSTSWPVARYDCSRRRNSQLSCHAGSAKRRSPRAGALLELPATTPPSSAA